MKPFLLAALLGAAFFISANAAEISAFDAGKIDSPTPYGLTDNEKVLLKNTKQVDSLGKNVGSVKIQVGTLQEQIEGVRSVLDGTNSRMGKMDGSLRKLEEEINRLDTNVTGINEEIVSMKGYLNESRELQEANYEKIKTVLAELSSLIDSINTNYVAKSSLETLERRLSALEESQNAQKTKAVSNELASKSGALLMQEGLRLFESGDLEAAKDRYEMLVEKRYKPARSNYYLGEIAYKQKAWNRAIKHYKISIGLYDKADYTPRLLYHTAISFDKLNDKTSADRFYGVLKSNYPTSEEAKASPNR